jgi:hypothetical protein
MQPVDKSAIQERCLTFLFTRQIAVATTSSDTGLFEPAPRKITGRFLAHFFADLAGCNFDLKCMVAKHWDCLPVPLRQQLHIYLEMSSPPNVHVLK